MYASLEESTTITSVVKHASWGRGYDIMSNMEFTAFSERHLMLAASLNQRSSYMHLVHILLAGAVPDTAST